MLKLGCRQPNYLDVGRLITDIDQPKLVNESISKQVIDIVGSNKRMEFYKFLLDRSELHIRRMQYNVMGESCFVGMHLDTDSNPDYLVAVVIQLGENFKGGEYVVYGGGKPPRSFSPPRFSVIFSDCRYEHEVKKIKTGLRKSLVFFLSTNNGKNARTEIKMKLGYFTQPFHPTTKKLSQSLGGSEAAVIADRNGYTEAIFGEHATDAFETSPPH